MTCDKSIFIFHTILTFFAFILHQPTFVESKAQYVMPLLGGLKMSLNYDIANLFIRPIGSSVSVFLSIFMFFIILFGIVTSPFGYMFGIPSRKYVLGNPRSLSLDPEPIWQISEASSVFMDDGEAASFTPIPTFEDQVFYLLPPDPQTQTTDCKLLALCFAHIAIGKLPLTILKITRLISEKLIQLSPAHKEAIKTGLRNQDDCTEVYNSCKETGYSILAKTVLYLLPKSMKNHSHRRKKAMYM